MSLNDPRWGRTGDDQTKPAQTGGETPKNEAENTQPAGSDAPRTGAPQAEAPRGDMPRAEEPRADNNSRPRQQQNGAADLDQLWDDFNRALGGLLGGRGQANRGRNPQEKNFDDRGLNDFRPDNGGVSVWAALPYLPALRSSRGPQAAFTSSLKGRWVS